MQTHSEIDYKPFGNVSHVEIQKDYFSYIVLRVELQKFNFHNTQFLMDFDACYESMMVFLQPSIHICMEKGKRKKNVRIME